jgi:Icc-related predicted phosphoesterase
MRLLCITDLHGRLAKLADILDAAGPVDMILFGGDITDFGSPIDVEKAIRAAQQSRVPVFAVAGNCDSAEIDRRLEELGVSVSGRGVTCGSIGLHGVSGMPPWRRGMFQLTEEELAALLQAGYGQIAAPHHVVLAHVPPRGTRLDRTVLLGKHAGSAALRTFIEQTQPALVICGHIHEGRGIDEIGKTTVVNCGRAAGGEYAMADVDETVTVTLHVEKR